MYLLNLFWSFSLTFSHKTITMVAAAIAVVTFIVSYEKYVHESNSSTVQTHKRNRNESLLLRTKQKKKKKRNVLIHRKTYDAYPGSREELVWKSTREKDSFFFVPRIARINSQFKNAVSVKSYLRERPFKQGGSERKA